MRTKVKVASPATVLERLLEALEQELIEAPDEDLLQAAADMGMNLQMRGSAAFLGLTSPALHHLSDFFDLEACQQLQVMLSGKRVPALPEPSSPSAPRRRARAKGPRHLKTGKEGEEPTKP